MASIARAADVSKADVKIDKIESVRTLSLPSMRAPILDWRSHMPQAADSTA